MKELLHGLSNKKKETERRREECEEAAHGQRKKKKEPERKEEESCEKK